MSWIWVVLGALLIALVTSVLIGFFYWRPRAQKRVTAASQALAEELHGRPPLLIAPAQCRKADLRDAASLPGLGVLYSTGERVVILARDGLQVRSNGTNLEFASQTPQGRLVLTLPDPAPWMQALA